MDIAPYSLFALAMISTLSLVSCAGPKAAPADLVLRGGKIATVDSTFSLAEAVAIRGDSIVAVGKNSDITPFIGSRTRVIELQGRLAVPGLIDAHVHLLGLGQSLTRLDFRGTTSYRQIADMVATEVKRRSPGEWILGSNWDQNDWEGKEMPSREALTAAAPENPVWLVRVDGHAGVANDTALKLCGITTGVKSPEGGEILRGKSGQITGVFVDNAMPLISSRIPAPTSQERERMLVLAAQRCLEAGLTGVQDAGVSPETVRSYQQLIDRGELGLRVYAMLDDPGEGDIAAYLRENRVEGYGNHFLEVRSVKLFMDGAMGSRGAALREPYSDRPGYSGLLTTTPQHVREVAKAALETGFQVCAHAIGDRANRLVLDAYEQALKEHPSTGHRFRIEHAQVVAPEDFPRFAALGVIPSMQPTHATSDMPWAEDRLGPERVKGAYAWRTFLDSGCFVPCGSDFPVEEFNPLYGVHAGITRQDRNGNPPGGWFPGQRMTREEALRGFTIWAARAAFQEHILGSIETGKLADLVVLSKDILTIPPEEILTTVPEYTIVGGKVKYERKR